ncbi:MAG: hypothetical protein ACRENL_02805 [Candidatus Dormibacteria bacterium]
MDNGAERWIALWREPGVRVLDNVAIHRANVPTLGIGVAADFLLNISATLVHAEGLGEGWTAGPKVLPKEWPIIVVGFTEDGPSVLFPGSAVGLTSIALEAAIYFRELCTFEQQQVFVGAAMAQAQQQRVVNDILKGARAT